MKPIYFIYTCVAYVLAYLTIDICLPALPGMQAYFGVSVASLQAVLSVYLFGLTFSQLFFAPMIDRYGYRLFALIGVVGFVFASLACAYSPSLDVLLVMRFFQAVFAALVALVARASMPRLYSADEMVKILLIVGPLMSLSPAFAPMLGGYLSWLFSWRAIFVFLLIFGLVHTILTWKAQRLGPVEGVDHSFKIRDVLGNYLFILKRPQFLACLLAIMSTFFAYFTYLSESPFIFHHLGYTDKAIGHFYLYLAVAYVVGSLSARFSMRYVSSNTILYIGFCLNGLGSLCMMIAGLFVFHVAFFMIWPMMIFVAGNGFSNTVLMSKGASYFPKRAAYAVALLNAFGLMSSGLASSVVQALTHGQLFRLGLLNTAVIIFGISAFFLFYLRPTAGAPK